MRRKLFSIVVGLLCCAGQSIHNRLIIMRRTSLHSAGMRYANPTNSLRRVTVRPLVLTVNSLQSLPRRRWWRPLPAREARASNCARLIFSS